jgi:hypothetical protein
MIPLTRDGRLAPVGGVPSERLRLAWVARRRALALDGGIGGCDVAYLNLLASASESDVERLCQDPIFVVRPSLVLG